MAVHSIDSRVEYAASVGFSPSVARRVASKRPDILEAHQRLSAQEPTLKAIYFAYRGLHERSFAEFQPRSPVPPFVDMGSGRIDLSQTWAVSFANRGRKGMTPGHLVRGFIFELEMPAHLVTFSHHTKARDLKEHGRELAHVLSKYRAAVTVDEEAADFTPFISCVGVINAENAIETHSYDDLFTWTGELTPLARRLDALMLPRHEAPSQG